MPFHVASTAVSSGHPRHPRGIGVFSLCSLIVVMACGPRHIRHATIPGGDDGGADDAIAGAGGAAGDGGAGGSGGNAGSGPQTGGSGGSGETGGTGGVVTPDAARDVAPPRDLRPADAPRDLAADLPSDPARPPPDLTPDKPPPDTPPGPDLTRGLVGYWKFDEGMGTTAADSSGKDNTGTLGGGAVWTTGAPFPMSGGALTFDGTNDVVTLRQNLAPVLGGTATLAFWIRTTQKGDDVAHSAPGVTGVEENDGANDVFWGFIDADGGIGVAAANSAGVHSDPISDNKWHHVALTRETGGKVQVFVDGQLARAGTTTAGTKSTAFTAIGKITNSASLAATLDDLRIYDHVLVAADIAALAAH
jgi:hypothetical protein